MSFFFFCETKFGFGGIFGVKFHSSDEHPHFFWGKGGVVFFGSVCVFFWGGRV